MGIITKVNDLGLNGNGYCEGCGKKLPEYKRFWCNQYCCNLAKDKIEEDNNDPPQNALNAVSHLKKVLCLNGGRGWFVMNVRRRLIMHCPNCGSFIGIYCCETCAGITTKTSGSTGGE